MRAFCFALVLTMLCFGVPICSAASGGGIWWLLEFHAPAEDAEMGGAVTRYLMGAKDQYGHFWVPALYNAPNVASGRPVPNAPGMLDSVYLWIPHDGRGRIYFLISEDDAGNKSPPSNFVLLMATRTASGKDTLFCDVTGVPDRNGSAVVCSVTSSEDPQIHESKFSRAPDMPMSTASAGNPIPDRIFSGTPVAGLGPIVLYQTALTARPDLCQLRAQWCSSGLICP